MNRRDFEHLADWLRSMWPSPNEREPHAASMASMLKDNYRHFNRALFMKRAMK